MNTSIVARPQPKQIFTFKGKTRLAKPKFLQKMVAHRITIQDASHRHFCTSLSVFMPKLDPKHTKANIMLHGVNSNGSCLMRVKDPETLAVALSDLVAVLRSDKWLDAWWRISDLSAKIINNEEYLLDEELMDINAWNESLEGTVDIQLVQVKKEEGGEQKNG